MNDKIMGWASNLIAACNTLDKVEIKGISNMDMMYGVYNVLLQMSQEMQRELQQMAKEKEEADTPKK